MYLLYPSQSPCPSLQVDLLYLHNSAEAQLASVGREAFSERLLEAFKFLEGEELL